MRLRIRFTKLGKIRWTSHRDIARMWERALRRTQLPAAYSEGFSPRPKISFGLALPTGGESLAEYLDIDLAEPVATAGLAERLSTALPGGLDVVRVAEADSRGSLQQDVTSCSWEIGVPSSTDLAALVDAGLAARELVVSRERKGHITEDDIRPAVKQLAVHDGRLVCELATQPRGVRPAELLGALGVVAASADIRRTHQWIERDGARWEPLPPDAPALNAQERAS
ncbi:MAG TPA: TIGR03936 family radical SAM-associated protein [Acidimicrobiales bacterium]|nr:TIGR03936 family radical SAM-associated protein [Acidimicrobiales bacterium]